MGLIDAAEPIVLQLYVEPLQRFRLAARGHGRVVAPETHRERIATYFDPLPFWYMPLEEARADGASFPLHALTQRPMQMYHSWHSQNAWLRQILGDNRLFVNRASGRALGLAEDDWVWLSSHNGRIRVPTKLMDGVNQDTVWTWNAIGKRAGAWNLDPASPEFRKGFSAQPFDLGASPAGWRLRLCQRRPNHRPGCLVRSARADRAGSARRGPYDGPLFPATRTPRVARRPTRNIAIRGGNRTQGIISMPSEPEPRPGAGRYDG